MKFEDKKNKIKVTNAGTSQKFSISDESAVMVIDSLINLYSDPIGSLIRELVSNAVDANRERDLKIKGELELEKDDILNNFSKSNPFVEVTYKEGNKLLNVDHCISIKDWGNGLSPDRVANVFTVLGSSTKRITDKLIGGYGIGAKSAFSYTDTFYVKAIHNKIERMYMLFKGNNLPEMTLVHEKSSNEVNSTDVIIPLKKSSDRVDFKMAIKQQLLFFSAVKFLGFGEDFNLPESLYESEDLIIPNTEKSTSSLKCIVGRVIYPIDFSLLETIKKPDQYRVNGYIRFKIGEVDLVPSRENLRYTDKTIDAIINKLKLIKAQSKLELIKKLENEKDFLKWIYTMLNIKSFQTSLYSTPDNRESEGIQTLIQLSEYTVNSDVNSDILSKNWPELPENTLQILKDEKNLIGIEFKVPISYYSQSFKANRTRLDGVSVKEFIKTINEKVKSQLNIFHVENMYSGLKTAALIKDYGMYFTCFKSNSKVGYKGIDNNAEDILNEERVKVGNFIFKCLEKDYSHNISSYSDIDISCIKPEEDVDIDLQKFRKLNETVFYKELIRESYPNDKTIAGLKFKTRPNGIKVSELVEMVQKDGNVIYGYSDDDHLLKMIGGIIHSIKPEDINCNRWEGILCRDYKIIKISKQHSKKFAQFTYVNDFFMDKYKELIEYCTSYKIQKIMYKLNETVICNSFDLIDNEISKVWDKVYNKYKPYESRNTRIYGQEDLQNEIIKLCSENNLYDIDLVQSAEALLEYVERIPLVDILRDASGGSPCLTITQADELRDILNYKNIKLKENPYYTEIKNKLPILEEEEN